MKKFNKILKSFQDVYCKLGVHNWVYNSEKITLRMPDRNRVFKDVPRSYRICSNCLKCQHNGIGIFRDKWFDEDEVETNTRPIARSLKLKKINNNIK